MVTTRQKQGAGVIAAALLLLGSAYAWQSADQHKTNELRDTFKDNDVTLVEDFVPITNWLQGQEVNKDISVKNNTTAETGNNAYVRIQLKEFLEFTDKTEERSPVRYAVTTEGNFAKFDTLEAAQAYANANNLTGSPVQITETAFEGANKYFIPTNAEATHGQYGKFLVLKVGDGTSKSIIDPDVSKAESINHQDITHEEDDYTTQLFNSGDDKLRTYEDLVKNYPTGGGIDSAKDLKDYISWTFGDNITTTDTFTAAGATTGQWVIDTTSGWVYWSEALQPGQTTGQFLDSLTLTLAPKNVSLYYAIHTDLEAVDYNDIDTMAPPTEIGTAWKNQKFTVTFESNEGSEVAPVSVSRDSLITKPSDPTKTDYKFAGWYAKSDLTGSAWNFATDKMPAANLTLYAKWEESTPALEVASTDPGSEFDFANAKWRILKTDMDDDATNGNQALVIRVSTLTNAEAGKEGTATDEASVLFRDGNTYFSADGSNGYQAGAGNPNYLKGAIDNYYTNYIANNADYVKYVQAVDLHNPSFAEFKASITFDDGGVYSDWQWSNYYKDTRFKTTLDEGGAKQAFALSYGDIHTIAGVGADDNITAKLGFASVLGSDDSFLLRSAGDHYDDAGGVGAGNFYNFDYVHYTLPVRPALSLQIQ